MEPGLILNANERRFALVGIDISVRAGVTDTGGALTALEQRVPRGAGSPLHTIREDKVLIVLDGEISLRLGAQLHRLAASDGARIPGGTPHRFFNEREATARILMLVMPGGHERYLAELAQLEAKALLTEPNMHALQQRFGVVILATPE